MGITPKGSIQGRWSYIWCMMKSCLNAVSIESSIECPVQAGPHILQEEPLNPA